MKQKRCHSRGRARKARGMGKPGSHGPNRQGFTLIELLVTVVILGILAAIATQAGNPKDAAYKAQMVSDLRNLVTAQEAYFADYSTYAKNVNSLDWAGTTGVLDIVIGKTSGWTARVKHQLLPNIDCAIFMGTVKPIFKPAVEEGVAACTS